MSDPANVSVRDEFRLNTFPPAVAQALDRAQRMGVPDVFWIEKPDAADYAAGVQGLIRQIME